MNHIKGIIFDYGNTLVEFAAPQITACDSALAAALVEIYGPLDREKLRAIRDRNRMEPYTGDPPDYRDNDLRVITRDLIGELYQVDASPEVLDKLVQVRFDAFLENVEAADGVVGVLERLGRRYPLGLLSNYPDGSAIRASLEKTGLARFFCAVVVSNDMGYCKPHPLPFQMIVEKMGMQPGELMLVGDNWLADIQGAKRAGMAAVLTTQWVSYEVFERHPADFEPDLVIKNLVELEQYL